MGIYPTDGFASATPVRAAGVATVGLTGDANIDGVLSGSSWNALNLTYAFPTSSAFYPSDYGAEPGANFGAVTNAQIIAANAAFAAVASYTNLTFTQIDPAAGYASVDFAFGNTDASSTAHAYYPDNGTTGGDVWYGRQYDYTNPQKGNYAWMTVVHEIGHALGLKHGHEEGTVLPTEHDSNEFSIMTYRSYIGADPASGSGNGEYSQPQTFMMYDIAALQHMYGANYNTNSGNTVYKLSTTGELFVDGVGQGASSGGSANKVYLTIWDGNGSDTYDFSEYTTNQLIDLAPGKWSLNSAQQQAEIGDGNLARGSVFNSVLHNGDIRSLIENAIGGSGNDSIYGNQVANSLWGGGGDDLFYQSGGSDTYYGGSGNDRVIYAGLRAEFAVSLVGDGTVKVTQSGGAVDTLSEVELMRFADSYGLAFSTSSNAEAAYKLYGGAFDRTPDYGGFKFWIDQWLDLGKTLHDAAESFLTSSEFVSRYGSQLSDTQYVDALYQNVLHRAGEDAGRTYWQDYLGNSNGDRADVLMNFTQLSEFTENQRPNMTNGFWVLDA